MSVLWPRDQLLVDKALAGEPLQPGERRELTLTARVMRARREDVNRQMVALIGVLDEGPLREEMQAKLVAYHEAQEALEAALRAATGEGGTDGDGTDTPPA